MRHEALRHVLGKECRALAPVWLAGTVAVAASSLAPDLRTAAALFVLAYFGTCVALGALSMGHEYAHRTLPLALALPIARGRLFTAKFAVLALLLASLSGVMWLMQPWPADSMHSALMPATVLLVGPGCALFLGPLLTMLCRSTLAGMVFTVVIPALLLTAADLTAAARFGVNQPALSDAFKLRLFLAPLAAICLAGAVAAPWLFGRLQTIEGNGGTRVWLRRAAEPKSSRLRRRSPTWLLVAKELRLQAMTFTVTGLYLAVWLAVSLVGHTDRGVVPYAMNLYCGLLAILAGALSSAEERQHGALEWQLLLPMSAWRQWMVKMGVTFTTAVLLAGVLPFALLQEAFVLPPWSWLRAVLVVTGVSIYVSSLVTGGTRAMVMAIFAVLVSISAWGWLLTTAPRWLSWAFGLEPIPFRGATVVPWLWWHRAVSTAVEAAIVVALVGFAFANHRSVMDRGPRVARQGAVLFGLMVLGVLALSSLRFVRFGS